MSCMCFDDEEGEAYAVTMGTGRESRLHRFTVKARPEGAGGPGMSVEGGAT